MYTTPSIISRRLSGPPEFFQARLRRRISKIGASNDNEGPPASTADVASAESPVGIKMRRRKALKISPPSSKKKRAKIARKISVDGAETSPAGDKSSANTVTFLPATNSESFWMRSGKGVVAMAVRETNSRPLTGVIFEPFEEVKKELSMVANVPQVSLTRHKYADDSEAAIDEQINGNANNVTAASARSLIGVKLQQRKSVKISPLKKHVKVGNEVEDDVAEGPPALPANAASIGTPVSVKSGRSTAVKKSPRTASKKKKEKAEPAGIKKIRSSKRRPTLRKKAKEKEMPVIVPGGVYEFKWNKGDIPKNRIYIRDSARLFGYGGSFLQEENRGGFRISVPGEDDCGCKKDWQFVFHPKPGGAQHYLHRGWVEFASLHNLTAGSKVWMSYDIMDHKIRVSLVAPSPSALLPSPDATSKPSPPPPPPTSIVQSAAQPAKLWLPLESSPQIMNEFLWGLGLPREQAECVDVYSLDDQAIETVPTPVLAVLFLYPISAASEAGRGNDLSVQQGCNEDVYFVKQTVANSCGTIALLHVVGNAGSSIQLRDHSVLRRFFDSTLTMNPQERADYIENDKELEHGHFMAATAIDTVGDHTLGTELKIDHCVRASGSKTMCADNVEKDKNLELPHFMQAGAFDAVDLEKVDNHFVSFSCIDGELYELDGRLERPISHGPSSPSTLLQDATKVIKGFIEKNPSSMQYSVIALCKKN